MFTRALYGYSVLDLHSLQDYHFYPAGSFPEGETFIWSSLHYNPVNSVLAVGGCYWACPYSVALVDFAQPLQDNVQIDVNDYLNRGYEHYDDIDFSTWEGPKGTDLILPAERQTEPVQTEVLRIPSERYMAWLAAERTT